MPFGELVCGAPGSGKSTYCYGKYQLFNALGRPVWIVNLDPANDGGRGRGDGPAPPYPAAIDISELISLREVMDTHGLGPNGAMLYCMEYLEANFDWLESRLAKLGRDPDNPDERKLGENEDLYVVFDLPGQVELSTNHDSVKNIINRLSKGKMGFRLASVHFIDSHYITDAAKYISVLLLSLRAMLHLELPHINVLSKVDLLASYGELPFNLDFYTEVQDLSYLFTTLEETLPPKYARLNEVLIELVEEFGLVGFEVLAVEDKDSMMHLTRAIDRATGYIFVPPPPSTSTSATPSAGSTTKPPPSARQNTSALFQSAAGPMRGPASNIRDIQERWVDHREIYDSYEKAAWRREGEAVRDEAARARAADAQTQTQTGADQTGAGGASRGGIRIRERKSAGTKKG